MSNFQQELLKNIASLAKRVRKLEVATLVPQRADPADVIDGTDDTIYVTPETIHDAGILPLPPIATPTEIAAGLNNTHWITPEGLAQSGYGSTAYGVTLSSPANDSTSGIRCILPAAQYTKFGQVGYINASGQVALGSNVAIATASVVAMCANTSIIGGASGTWLLIGFQDYTLWNWTPGALLFLGTLGQMTETAPITTDSVIQVLGRALSTRRVFFNPSLSQVEHI